MTICINCMGEIEEDTEVCPYCGAVNGCYDVNHRALPPYTLLNGKYLIGRVLGEGGFGITYLAYDRVLKKGCSQIVFSVSIGSTKYYS